jgi:hypothetical protein
MPYKDPEKQKAAQKAWYNSNKELTLSRTKAFREKSKQVVRDIKESSPCTDCKMLYPYYIMQFDHIDSTIKEDGVSNLLRNSSLSKALHEISKCELVCANCHAARTWKRQHGIEV